MKFHAWLSRRLAPLLIGSVVLVSGVPARAQATTDTAGPSANDESASTFLPSRNPEGRGYTFGSSGLTLGGYAAAEAADYQGADAGASFKSLSLMLWWENESRWSFFSEVEAENLATVNGSALDDGGDRELSLERLHVDYAWSDALQFRAGKFLTPIGRWNIIHAAPLTWTTSRPLITETTFPTNATGAMVRGVVPVGGHALDWSLYASPGKELAPEDDIDPFREAYGLRLDYELGYKLQLGVSIVEFEQQHERGGHKTLYGVDFLWQRHGYELSGEWAYRLQARGNSSADERGAYVQGVVPLYATLYGVLRYENFSPAGATDDLNLYVAGLAWRFRPGWVTKLEYRHATDNGVGVPEGWLGSIAVLF